MPEISVVIPVYGCDSCLGELHRRLTHALRGIPGGYELIFIDDRSPDGSWQLLRELAAGDPALRAHRLSRNFGEEAAITAGLTLSRGRWTVVMDCDLQDAPEDIPRLHAKASEGYEIVFTRRNRTGHSAIRILGSRLYFRLLKKFLQGDIDAAFGNFSIVSRKALEHSLSLRDKDRHYRAILVWLGFNHTAIDVNHAPRHAGSSSYTFGRLVRHAVDGVFFQTAVLLRWIVLGGFAMAISGLVLAAWFAIDRFATGADIPGWSSLAVIVLLVGASINISLGVTSLYVGKIFSHVKDRPVFVIDESVVEGSPEHPPLPASTTGVSAD